MKTYQSKNHLRGFTLIELLVVITIIAILASIAVPTGNIVMQRARNTQAKAAMASLIIGIKGYQTEYNRYPGLSKDGDSTTDPVKTTADSAVMKAIIFDKSVATNDQDNPNPRQIPFYEKTPAKGGANGYDNNLGLVDPWGQNYWMVIDYAGDGYVKNPYSGTKYGATTEPENISSGVIVYSWGADKQDGSKVDNSDDVKSW